MVYLVTFTKESLSVGSKLFADIQQYIDDNYVEEHFDYRRERARCTPPIMRSMEADYSIRECAEAPMAAEEDEWNPSSIEDALNMIDESFSEMVGRIADGGLWFSYGCWSSRRNAWTSILTPLWRW